MKLDLTSSLRLNLHLHQGQLRLFNPLNSDYLLTYAEAPAKIKQLEVELAHLRQR